VNMQMPRKLPLFVVRERTRHGTVVFYFRRGKGTRRRLPAPTDEGFEAAYQEALTGAEPPRRARSAAGSLRWLIDRYRETAEYRSKSTATRRQRDYIFSDVLDTAGSDAFRDITRKDIKAAVERREHTPSQARNFLDAMRGVFRWAFDAELIDTDPTASVKNPPRPKTSGFRAWSEDDIAAFERQWPLGTKEHVWLHVLLYTGLRRGDAVILGRQHVRGGVATLRTEKNDTEVNIPILPILAETLAIGPTGDLAFIVGVSGRPLTKETFGNFFKQACVAAGLMDHSSHGVRKIGATRAAEAGATVAELEALFGWHGGAMASLYTRTADRKRLARQASEKIGNIFGPHLSSGAGAAKIK
jgi:integrase